MAISHRASGSWAYAASGSVTTTLPTHATGDMLIVRVAYKSSNIASCAATTATSGWGKVGEQVGTGNSGNGTGGVTVAAFWKIATSASETNPTIDFSQTVTQVGHVAISYQKASTEAFLTPVGAGGEDTTADTSKSMTMASHVSVTSGDMVDFFLGVRDDCTMTVPTITQASVTFAAVSEQPATAGTDTSGADGAYDGGYRLATSGTSSAAAVITGTLNTSETGTAWQTRLRVVPFDEAPAEVATATGAANDATVIVAPGPQAATATGAANDAVVPITLYLTEEGRVTSDTVSEVGVRTFSEVDEVGRWLTFNDVVAGEVNAGLASATGAASSATVEIVTNASVATATGAANDATVQTGKDVAAEVATATGAANDAVGTVVTNANVATATGTANAASADVAPNADDIVGVVTGQAYGITADVAPGPQAATATGAANQPSVAIAVNAGLASAIGVANDATVSTATNTNANAEVATATGAANQPSASVAVNAGLASATGLANDATVSTASSDTAEAELASATGAANQPSLSIVTNAAIASATGAANAAAGSVAPNAGLASATGAANDATTTSTGGAISATAELATAIGQAYDATIHIVQGGHGGKGTLGFMGTLPDTDDEETLLLLIA